jgi:predicted AAA+ superfamily ATPase
LNTEYPEKLSFQTIDCFDLYLTTLSKTKHYLLIDEVNKIKGWHLLLEMMKIGFAIRVDKNS